MRTPRASIDQILKHARRAGERQSAFADALCGTYTSYAAGNAAEPGVRAL
jgi:hypothetical protein